MEIKVWIILMVRCRALLPANAGNFYTQVSATSPTPHPSCGHLFCLVLFSCAVHSVNYSWRTWRNKNCTECDNAKYFLLFISPCTNGFMLPPLPKHLVFKMVMILYFFVQTVLLFFCHLLHEVMNLFQTVFFLFCWIDSDIFSILERCTSFDVFLISASLLLCIVNGLARYYNGRSISPCRVTV